MRIFLSICSQTCSMMFRSGEEPGQAGTEKPWSASQARLWQGALSWGKTTSSVFHYDQFLVVLEQRLEEFVLVTLAYFTSAILDTIGAEDLELLTAPVGRGVVAQTLKEGPAIVDVLGGEVGLLGHDAAIEAEYDACSADCRSRYVGKKLALKLGGVDRGVAAELAKYEFHVVIGEGGNAAAALACGSMSRCFMKFQSSACRWGGATKRGSNGRRTRASFV